MKLNKQIINAIKESTLDFQINDDKVELRKDSTFSRTTNKHNETVGKAVHQQFSDIFDTLSNMDIYTYDTMLNNKAEQESYKEEYLEDFNRFKNLVKAGCKFVINNNDENVRTYNTDTDVTIYSNSFFDILNIMDTAYIIFGEKSGTAFCEGIDFSWLDASNITRFSVDILKDLSIDTNEKSLQIISDIMK